MTRILDIAELATVTGGIDWRRARDAGAAASSDDAVRRTGAVIGAGVGGATGAAFGTPLLGIGAAPGAALGAAGGALAGMEIAGLGAYAVGAGRDIVDQLRGR